MSRGAPEQPATALPIPAQPSDAVRSLTVAHQLLRAERSTVGSTPVITECLRLIEQALRELGQPPPTARRESGGRRSPRTAHGHDGNPLPVSRPREASESEVVLRRDLDLNGPDATPAAARAFVREQCLTWGVTAVAMNSAIDVASELVTNAQEHGCGSRTLAISRTFDGLIIEVADRSEAPPRRVPYRRGFSEHGLGLALVQRLATEWGYHPVVGGKVVWATVPTVPMP